MKVNEIQPVFSVGGVDRMAHLRADILNNRNSETDKYVLISQGNVLINKDGGCFFNTAELADSLLNSPLCTFLGGDERGHYFALPVCVEEAEKYEIVPLRALLIEDRLSKQQFSLLAEANSMLSWHRSHGFCARCGSETSVSDAGWQRNCPSCEARHFPRTDPVVIMLVTKGDQCLLGRSPYFPDKQFSCLAGFMEPGETIEQAALRELYEEVGVVGENIRFLSNQPWPFPSNLMLGVHVEAKDMQLDIDHTEIEGARWVSKSDLNAVLAGDTSLDFILPPKIAIARSLLEYWVRVC